MMTYRSKKRKKYMLEEFKKFLREYRYVILVDSNRLKSSMLNEVRRIQYDIGFRIKGGKKTIFLKALEEHHPNAVDILRDEIVGQVLYIFTNKDPIKIAMKLDRFEVDIPASPGDISPTEIVIPKGSTGIPPGPIISIFSNLSIPTKIVGGAINVIKDTLIARPGDKITPNLATLLSKLSIKPIKSKVNLKAAYDLEDDILIKKNYLLPDMEKIKRELLNAYQFAVKISLEIAYPTRYTINILLSKAYANARKIAIETGYATPETLGDILITAYYKAVAFKKAISQNLS